MAFEGYNGSTYDYSVTDNKRKSNEQKLASGQYADTHTPGKLASNVDSVLSNAQFVKDDTKVSFGSKEFDKEAFNLAAEAQRNWWENTGSKGKQYGYDMTDPEDIQRASEGRYSVAYEKSYGDDEYSQWLLANGQASQGFFESKYYKEAYNSVMLERAKQEGVRNFNQAVVKELLATAADAENPTAEEIALAADRVKKTNPSFTNIGIADFGEDEADGNFATLHLDDVQDEYMAMWGKKRFQESVDQRRRTEQRNARIEAAVAASGYDATMGNATGLAYDSKRKQYDANQKKKVAATDAIVAELRAEGLATEEIRQYLAEDGRLSYDESTEKATIDAQTKAEKAAMDNSVLGSIFSDTRRGSRMSKAEESTTGYIPATALDVTTSLLQKAKDAANNRKVWENSPIAQSTEWVAANTLTEEELTEVKNIMANAREAFILQGYSGFEIDNFFRRNDLGEYLDPVAASGNYMTYTLGEWGYSDIEIQAVIDGLTDEDYETISKDMFLCDYVDTSTTDQIGYTMAAIPAIAAYRMVGDVVGFFDMVTAGDREELWGATQWLNDRAAYWTAIGTNGNHEFLSKTAEYGSEIVRLLAMQGVGQLAGAAVTGISAASKGTAWLTKAVWATESVPFVASAMGGYYTEAKGQGASTADATKYAVVAGAVEGLLEKLSMGEFVKGHFGSNLIGKKLMNGNTSGMVKQLFSRYGAQLADVLASSVGEGLEEGASYVASSLMRQATWDEDYAMTGQEFGQNFLGGLIIGGILGGLSAPADSQRYKYAMDIYNRTGSYTMNMDSLYAASYYETLKEGQRIALKEKFDSGEIVADNSTRKAAIQAEGELANMDKEIAAKHKALESAKADGENKVNLAQEKIANIDQRIAAYQDADLVKKARKITELLQQRQAAEKAYKTVLSETEKKTQQAEADYIAIKNKRTEKSVALTETIANYQTAKYFTDFYGIPQNIPQSTASPALVIEPATNTLTEDSAPAIQYDAVQRIAADALIEEVINGRDDIGALVNDYGDTLTLEQIEDSFKEGARQHDIKAVKEEIRNILISANYKIPKGTPNRDAMVELRNTVMGEFANGADIGSVTADYSDLFGYNRIETLYRLYGLRQKLSALESPQTPPASTSTAGPTENTITPANAPESRIDTVKMDTVESVNAGQLQETTEVDVESADPGYLEAVDGRIVEMVEAVRRNDTKYMPPLIISDVTPDLASEVNRITGIDVSGFKHGLQRDGIEHIEKRHGENGEADSSMANTEDIARIQYVLDNFDSVDIARKQNGKPVYSKKYKNKDGSPAPVLEFVKKVDGHYYVSEAIPDAAAQTLWITSARIVPNKKGAYQVPDASALTPGLRPNAELGFTPDNSIPNSAENSNPQLKDLGANTPAPVEMAQSKVYTNTYDKWLTEAEKAADSTNNSWYARSKEVDTLATAKSVVEGSIRRNGSLDSVMAQLQDKNAWDATDVDTAMLVAETLRAEAADTGGYSKLNEWKNIIRQNMTQSGQAIQALAKWTRNSSIGAENALIKAVTDINKQNKKKIESGAMAPIEIDPALLTELQNAQTRQERDAVMEKITADIGSKMNPGIVDKLNAWRYLSMLGNPRTILRNLIGNEIMSDVLWVGKDAVGSVLERGLDQSQRTKALPFSEEYKANKAYAASTLEDVRHKLADGSRYDTKTGIEKAIEDETPVFRFKPVEAWRKGTNYALSKGDTVFLEKQYKRSLAQIMTARGYTADTMTAAQKNECINYAIEEAKRSTFHDASAVAEAISKLEKRNVATKVIVGGVLPFKKTPMNVLARGVDFSPIGLIQGTTQMLTKVKSGEVSAAQAVDKISSGLTGSALMALGVFLAKSGIITGGNEDEDKYYMSDLGHQEFALNVGGGHSVTIDWAAPATIPLFMGVALNSIIEGEAAIEGDNLGGKIDAFINTLSGITDPLVEMSMLQGLQDTLESAADANKDGESMLWGLTKNSGYNYVSQFVPTVGGQVARTIDPVRRDTAGDPTSELGKELDKVTNKMQAKIPGIADNLEPYINVWGEQEVNEHHWTVRLLENAILPGYLDETDMTDVDVEITRLYSETQNPAVIPSNYPYRTLKDTKTKDSYILTNEEYTAFKIANGRAMYAAALDAISDPTYSWMDDDERASFIAAAISEAQYSILSEYKKKYLNK